MKRQWRPTMEFGGATGSKLFPWMLVPQLRRASSEELTRHACTSLDKSCKRSFLGIPPSKTLLDTCFQSLFQQTMALQKINAFHNVMNLHMQILLPASVRAELMRQDAPKNGAQLFEITSTSGSTHAGEAGAHSPPHHGRHHAWNRMLSNGRQQGLMKPFWGPFYGSWCGMMV